MPPEGLQIRPAGAGDASRIASIHVRSKCSAYRDFMPADYLASLDQDGHRIERWQPYFAAGHPENRAWMAFVEGIPAGFVALERPSDEGVEAAPPGYVFLHQIHAAPEFRGRGLGAALLRTAVAHASDAGARGVALWTNEHNEVARAFYERMGWRLDGAEADVEYRWAGPPFTARNVRYVLSLSPRPS
ncbi:MAG: GNAT family N-acetyltransferase [Dehalococcoidia bacterium]